MRYFQISGLRNDILTGIISVTRRGQQTRRRFEDNVCRIMGLTMPNCSRLPRTETVGGGLLRVPQQIRLDPSIAADELQITFLDSYVFIMKQSGLGLTQPGL